MNHCGCPICGPRGIYIDASDDCGARQWEVCEGCRADIAEWRRRRRRVTVGLFAFAICCAVSVSATLLLGGVAVAGWGAYRGVGAWHARSLEKRRAKALERQRLAYNATVEHRAIQQGHIGGVYGAAPAPAGGFRPGRVDCW